MTDEVSRRFNIWSEEQLCFFLWRTTQLKQWKLMDELDFLLPGQRSFQAIPPT